MSLTPSFSSAAQLFLAFPFLFSYLSWYLHAVLIRERKAACAAGWFGGWGKLLGVPISPSTGCCSTDTRDGAVQ